MLKRYCDFCGAEIKDGDRRNEIIWHGIFEHKVDVCAECWDNCILGKIVEEKLGDKEEKRNEVN